MTEEKICYKCYYEKPSEELKNIIKVNSKKCDSCKEKRKEKIKKYYEDNPEKKKQKNEHRKKYYEKNKEKIKEQSKKYYEDNPEIYKEIQKRKEDKRKEKRLLNNPNKKIYKLFIDDEEKFKGYKQSGLLKKAEEIKIKGLSGITIRRKLKDNNEIIKDNIKITVEFLNK